MKNPLSPRETEITRMLAEGYDAVNIITTLGIKQPTFGAHLLRIHRKLEVHNRAQLVLAAQKLGIVGNSGDWEGRVKELTVPPF